MTAATVVADATTSYETAGSGNSGGEPPREAIRDEPMAAAAAPALPVSLQARFPIPVWSRPMTATRRSRRPVRRPLPLLPRRPLPSTRPPSRTPVRIAE